MGLYGRINVIFDFETVVKEMQRKNKLFVSERNLQTEFIITANTLYPGLAYYPEFVYENCGKTYHIDLVISDGNETIPIEFKYVTQGGKICLVNCVYELKNHAAIDVRRHQFVKDVSRLEEFKSIYQNVPCGYALLVTNMRGFWKGSPKSKAATQFDIYDGSTLSQGTHAFGGGYKICATYSPVTLTNSYHINYRDYIKGADGKEYKYLVVKV